MINKSDFYLQDVELLKQLEPIMVRKEIPEDGYYLPEIDMTFISLSVWEDKYKQYRTYRKDSLEAAFDGYDQLIEIYYGEDSVYPAKLMPRTSTLAGRVLRNRGQESLKALASLIILLDKELNND